VVPEDAQTAWALLAVSDQRLYAAKSAGGNQFVVGDDESTFKVLCPNSCASGRPDAY